MRPLVSGARRLAVGTSVAAAAALLGALPAAGPARAQGVVPLGGEFQVNTYTTNSQFSSHVAADADGDFVVVWLSDGSPGDDSSSDSIQGQRYASDGTPRGGQFQVNSYTTNRQ